MERSRSITDDAEGVEGQVPMTKSPREAVGIGDQVVILFQLPKHLFHVGVEVRLKKSLNASNQGVILL